MMAPFVYEEARANAPLHAQLVRYDPTAPQADTSSIHATGRVLRIFRNQGRPLYLGRKISFFIPTSGGEGAPMLDGTIRLKPAYLYQSRFWEGFFEFWDGEFHLVRSQIAPIRRPTWRSVCSPDAKRFLVEGNCREK
jgi:hypothetical protein